MLDIARYLQRRAQTSFDAGQLLRRLQSYRQKAASAADHGVLRGIEGTASRAWFDALAATMPTGWTFPGRRKRPPTDPVNALLSLGYTVLYHRIEAACQAWGLDPCVGVLHEYRPGRSSLACDLVEPFRVPAVDRPLIQTLTAGEFSADDFVQNPDDHSVRLTEESWKRWLGALEAAIHDTNGRDQSLQTQMVQRVGLLADALPEWDGRWPSAEILGTITAD